MLARKRDRRLARIVVVDVVVVAAGCRLLQTRKKMVRKNRQLDC